MTEVNLVVAGHLRPKLVPDLPPYFRMLPGSNISQCCWKGDLVATSLKAVRPCSN
jgi:hypothetical protein